MNGRIQQLYQYMQQDATRVRNTQGTAQQGAAGQAQGAARTARRDRVEISNQARNAERMQAQLRQQEQARAQRVEQVRQQVQQGTYQVNAKRTAYGMVRENIIDKLVR